GHRRPLEDVEAAEATAGDLQERERLEQPQWAVGRSAASCAVAGEEGAAALGHHRAVPGLADRLPPQVRQKVAEVAPTVRKTEPVQIDERGPASADHDLVGPK